ncbi:MAG: NAD-dependent epimerase/dehydratase family protein [Candidatus Micrarchaeota archaeon]
MEILITGGAGFIGSNIAEHLLKQGHSVSVIDNLHTGSPDNLKGLSVKFHKANVGEINKLDIPPPKIIFHEGIYSSSPMYMQNPHLMPTIIDEFLTLLEYARKHDSKIIFAATSSLYNGIQPPHKEDIIPKVTDYYTEGRVAMERLARLHNALYGQKTVGLRYFSVYGPREKSKKQYANLVSQFLWEMQKNTPPVIYGDGSQTRDFTYVEDVVKANMLAMEKNISFGIYNVGTGKSYSLNKLIEILNRKLSTSIKPKYVENKIKNYVQDTLADTSKAKKELGFEAKISLEEGIEKLLKK